MQGQNRFSPKLFYRVSLEYLVPMIMFFVGLGH